MTLMKLLDSQRNDDIKRAAIELQQSFNDFQKRADEDFVQRIILRRVLIQNAMFREVLLQLNIFVFEPMPFITVAILPYGQSYIFKYCQRKSR